jgi:hypothetical protein
MKKYNLTPEAREMLAPFHGRWLKIATDTTPMSDADRDIVRGAVEGLYRAAKLEPPPSERIVFVPSPMVAILAGGFSAAIWYMRANPDFENQISWAATGDATGDATGAATEAATEAAIRAATGDATWAATRAATGAATRDATGDATWAATWAATRAATGAAIRAATGAAIRAATGDATWAATGDAIRAATWDATWAATWAATRAATGDATGLLSPLAKWMLECAHSAHNMMAYGSEWTGHVEWIEFLREACGYERDGRVGYTNWYPWRDATLHGGVRIMHPEFCIVSDRPHELHIETENGRGRLHNDRGPAKRYSDGWSIYAIHGTRVTQQIVEAPETLTAQQVLGEANAEVRRVMVDRLRGARADEFEPMVET